MKEATRRNTVNERLTWANTNYHESLPIQFIDSVLEANEFRPMEEGIYCGRDGRVHEKVGANTWLSLTWHKMEKSNRFEVVAYVS